MPCVRSNLISLSYLSILSFFSLSLRSYYLLTSIIITISIAIMFACRRERERLNSNSRENKSKRLDGKRFKVEKE